MRWWRAALRARRRAWAGQVAGLFVLGVVGPLQLPNLDPAAIGDAVRIGQTSPQALDAFHAAYRIPIDDPVIRGLEVVTPFRRLVQLTEERARLRDVTWDASRAAVAAREFEGRLDLVLDLQFNPANTYRTVPRYSLVIYRRGTPAATLLPIDTRSTPRYLAGQPAPPGTPILAAMVRSVFDAAQIDASSPLLVGIFLEDREVRRVAVDLGTLR